MIIEGLSFSNVGWKIQPNLLQYFVLISEQQDTLLCYYDLHMNYVITITLQLSCYHPKYLICLFKHDITVEQYIYYSKYTCWKLKVSKILTYINVYIIFYIVMLRYRALNVDKKSIQWKNINL